MVEILANKRVISVQESLQFKNYILYSRKCQHLTHVKDFHRSPHICFKSARLLGKPLHILFNIYVQTLADVL